MQPDEGSEVEIRRLLPGAVLVDYRRGRGVGDHVRKSLAVREDRGQLDIPIEFAIGDRRRRRITIADTLCAGRGGGEAQDRQRLAGSDTR
jgi:hypothetical protein